MPRTPGRIPSVTQARVTKWPMRVRTLTSEPVSMPTSAEGVDRLGSLLVGYDAPMFALEATGSLHRAWAAENGERDRRRRDAARSEVEDLLREALVRRLRDRVGEDRVARAVVRVADRAIDPYAAVDELLKET